MGVLPGDRVTFVMEQRPETVASYMAVFSVGAVALPLSPRLSTDCLAARLNHAATREAIAATFSGPHLLQAQLQCPPLDTGKASVGTRGGEYGEITGGALLLKKKQ